MGFKKTKYQGKRLAAPEGHRERLRNAAEEAVTEETAVQPPVPPEPATQEPSVTAEAQPAAEKKAEKKKKEQKQGFWANYGYLIVTAAVVIIVFRVLLQLAFVPSGSMEHTIPTKSLLLSWQVPYLVSDPQPERGDVVTFWNRDMNKLLVKRVIGLPGDEITFSGGYVYINGQLLEENYLPAQGITKCEKTFSVPEGCLFMLGDNRTSSTDSRFWEHPYVEMSDVRARVLVCIPVTYWHGIPLPIISDIHGIG